jgi:hypothetical protein
MTRQDVVAAVSVVPDLSLALLAIVTWIDPQRFGTHLLGFFWLVAMTEIVVLQFAALVGEVAYSDRPRAARVWHTLGLATSTSVGLAALSIAFDSWWPLIGFWLQVLNRLLGVLLGQAPEGEERELVRKSWISGLVCSAIALAVALLPGWPWLGIRPGMLGPIDGSPGGDWIDDPQRALVFAIVYFSLVAIAGLFSYRWPTLKRSPARKSPATRRAP